MTDTTIPMPGDFPGAGARFPDLFTMFISLDIYLFLFWTKLPSADILSLFYYSKKFGIVNLEPQVLMWLATDPRSLSNLIDKRMAKLPMCCFCLLCDIILGSLYSPADFLSSRRHWSLQWYISQSFALGAAASKIGCNFMASPMLPLILSFRMRKACIKIV